MQKSIILALMVCLAQIGYTQTNFLNATITQKDGTERVGQIDYKEWSISPTTVQFKVQNEPPKSLSVHDIQAFTITDKSERYLSAAVEFYLETSNGTELSEFSSVQEALAIQNLVKDTVFLSVLASGDLNLYALVDKDRQEHFFIQKGNKPIQELGYRKIFLNTQTGKSLKELRSYVTQLQTETSDCLDIQEKIENADYKSESLKRIVNRYNDFKHKNSYVRPKDKNKIAFYGALGVNKSYTNYQIYQRYIRGIDHYNAVGSASPVFALGIDLGVTRNRNKLGFIFEMLYKTVNYSFSDQRNGGTFMLLDKYQFDMKFLQVNAFVRYTFRVGNVQPYIKAGAGLATIRTHDNKYTETNTLNGESIINTIQTKRREINANLNVGVKMKRFFLETRLSIGSNVGLNTYQESLKSDYVGLLVGYNFLIIN